VFEHFPMSYPRQALFHLLNKPLIVTNQALNRLVPQGLRLAGLFRRNLVEFLMKHRRKIDLQISRLEGYHSSVKTFPARRRETGNP
jgi:hypothetical protein